MTGHLNILGKFLFANDGGTSSYGTMLRLQGSDDFGSGYSGITFENVGTDFSAMDITGDPTQLALDKNDDWGFGVYSLVLAIDDVTNANANLSMVNADYDTSFTFDPANNVVKIGDTAVGTPTKLQTSSGRLKHTTRVTNTYTIIVGDEVVFANTDSTSYTVTLPAGVEGQTFKIINSGSSSNNLTIAPNGAEHLLGENSSFVLYDGETLIISYNSTDGWY